jgi:hypothetical protein
MLYGLLMKELTIPTLGDDFHCVILSCRLVESCLNALSMIERYDECDPHMLLWMSRSC